jgi:putrescine oxidase
VNRVEADVVVVGAGIAGLSAAKTLVEAGREVVVVEARDRVGGRVLNIEIGGQANELGGQWIAPYQDRARAYLDELGIELFACFRGGSHVYLDSAGTAHRYEGHDAPLGEASERAFSGGEALLDAMAKELDPRRRGRTRERSNGTRSRSRPGWERRSPTISPATCCARGSQVAS